MVVVAARDISLGAEVRDQDLTMRAWRATDLPPHTIISTSEATGRTIRCALRRGEVLQEPMLNLRPHSRPEGYQYLPFEADASVIRQLKIAPGDRVDVELDIRDATGILTLKDVTVLRVYAPSNAGWADISVLVRPPRIRILRHVRP